MLKLVNSAEHGVMLEVQSAHRVSPFESLVGYHLRRLSVLTMADLARSLAPLDLSPVSASVLFLIDARAGLTQSDVGKQLGILSANLTPLVAGLLKRGLIERERRDGRSRVLSLSPRGKQLHALAWKVAQAHEKRCFGILPAAARARLIAELRALWEAHDAPSGNGR
jgi:DNA-binding MarR family transcriptional regulator